MKVLILKYELIKYLSCSISIPIYYDKIIYHFFVSEQNYHWNIQNCCDGYSRILSKDVSEGNFCFSNFKNNLANFEIGQFISLS